MADKHPVFTRHTTPQDQIIDNFPVTKSPIPYTPPTAPMPTYGGTPAKPKKQRSISPLGRLIKFAKGDYTKE